MKYHLALLVYRLLILILLPLLIIFLLIRSINHPAYRQRILERLGFINQNIEKNSIVVHAASVGEVIAIKPFIEKLILAYPAVPITITTFTPTGSAQVKQIFKDRVQHCYLPVDNIVSTTLFLSKFSPKLFVFMETEIWPNLIAQCKGRRIPLLLINGRLSTKSIKQYKKISALITPTINAFDYVLTQSKPNQDNFLSLGTKKDICEISGNLKFDIALNDTVKQKSIELANLLEPTRSVWVVASTHDGDENIVLTAFEQLKRNHPELLMIIVPRHPERFNSVTTLCQQNYSVVRRSEHCQVSKNNDILVLDTLGELLPTCALADVVTIGGSFSSIGGHNPLEPALFHKPIICGSDMSNFGEIMQQLIGAKGIIQLPHNNSPAQQLVEQIEPLLASPSLREEYGNNAYAIVMQNQGASSRTLEKLSSLM